MITLYALGSVLNATGAWLVTLDATSAGVILIALGMVAYTTAVLIHYRTWRAGR